MIRLYVIAGVLLTTAAAAQGQGPVFAVDTPPKVGVWRTSDLIGRNVFGPEGEDVGEISDVILDQSGRIGGYVLSVGGIFGIGDRKVAVSPYALRIDTTVTTGTVSGGISPSTPGWSPGAGGVAVEQHSHARSDHRERAEGLARAGAAVRAAVKAALIDWRPD